MKRERAIRSIRKAARARDLVFTAHAYEKMDRLGETVESVSAAIVGSRSFVTQTDGSWRVFGDGVTCVVKLVDDVVVVTIFM
jgi:hypothetical protein